MSEPVTPADPRAAPESSGLGRLAEVDIDDMLGYLHRDLKNLPDYPALYRRYLRQRWDVYELDFTADRRDWTDRLTEAERTAFLSVAAGLHHGERQVEAELPVFLLGAGEEEKVFLASQLEDEARHTVFFDRFCTEAAGLPGENILAVLDTTFGRVAETFAGPFGLLAYQSDELRRRPDDQAARVRFGTTYFLWIEGVLALSVMKVTLSFCRNRGVLPGYRAGFTAVCRDEARHVQAGMRFLRDSVARDPATAVELHRTLRVILRLAAAASRHFDYEPLGWTGEEVRLLMIGQLRRKLRDVGIALPFDLSLLLDAVQPELAGG
ncbi:ribonucleotide reductase [Amycolatopsis sp. NPDC004079]|uniref:ribonucleotide reductase n=1 Tax=Amycolatopsis sp. NPDC004079 TaxID=3154549 RepID=UPI0033BBA2D5